MIEIRRTEEFSNWLHNLKDRQAQAKLFDRILRLADGNPGKSRSVGAGVVELKIDFGPGYRVYYIQRGEVCPPALWWRQEHTGKRYPDSKSTGRQADETGETR